MRTGCQWKALDATGICSSSSAHRRFQEWTQAGDFQTLWAYFIWLMPGLLTGQQAYWDRF